MYFFQQPTNGGLPVSKEKEAYRAHRPFEAPAIPDGYLVTEDLAKDIDADHSIAPEEFAGDICRKTPVDQVLLYRLPFAFARGVPVAVDRPAVDAIVLFNQLPNAFGHGHEARDKVVHRDAGMDLLPDGIGQPAVHPQELVVPPGYLESLFYVVPAHEVQFLDVLDAEFIGGKRRDYRLPVPGGKLEADDAEDDVHLALVEPIHAFLVFPEPSGAGQVLRQSLRDPFLVAFPLRRSAPRAGQQTINAKRRKRNGNLDDENI